MSEAVETLKENGFEEMTPEETSGLETEAYFYLSDENGDIHYFKNKTCQGCGHLECVCSKKIEER